MNTWTTNKEICSWSSSGMLQIYIHSKLTHRRATATATPAPTSTACKTRWMNVEIFEFIFQTKMVWQALDANSHDPPTNDWHVVGSVSVRTAGWMRGCQLVVHRYTNIETKRGKNITLWSKLNCNINGCDSQKRQTAMPTPKSVLFFILSVFTVTFIRHFYSSLIEIHYYFVIGGTSNAVHFKENSNADIETNAMLADKSFSLMNCPRPAIARLQMASRPCATIELIQFDEVYHGHRARTHGMRIRWQISISNQCKCLQ